MILTAMSTAMILSFQEGYSKNQNLNVMSRLCPAKRVALPALEHKATTIRAQDNRCAELNFTANRHTELLQ